MNTTSPPSENDNTFISLVDIYLIDPLQTKVSVITQFLCNRLEDEVGLKEVAQGLLAVAGMTKFQPGEAGLIASSYVFRLSKRVTGGLGY